MNGTDFLKTAAEILRENPLFKDQDLSETSVIYNTTLLPFALLTKPVADLNAYTLKSMKLDQMTDSQLDDFAAGYFVERRQTNVAVIDVTIYLKNEAAAIEPLIIYTTDEFRTASNEVFRPVTNYVFAYASLSLDETKTYRVANITVTGNALNVAENSIKTFTNSHPKIDHVTNLRPSSSPITRETNAELIKTIQRSIAERGNAKADSICTNLKNAFPYIVDVLPIGYGAQEMQRDIAVAAKSWSGHFGGNTDVYVRTTAAPATANIKGATKVAGVGYTFILRRYKGFDWNAIDTQAPQPNCLTPWLPLPTQDLPAAPVLYIDWAKTTVTNTSIKLGDNGIPQYSIEVMPDPSEKSYCQRGTPACASSASSAE